MHNDEKRRLFDAVVWTFSAMFLVLFLVHESHSNRSASAHPSFAKDSHHAADICDLVPHLASPARSTPSACCVAES